MLSAKTVLKRVCTLNAAYLAIHVLANRNFLSLVQFASQIHFDHQLGYILYCGPGACVLYSIQTLLGRSDST